MKTVQKILGIVAVFAAVLVARSASAATLNFSPASKTVSVGDTFSVDVLLDTEGQSIDGVDLKYLNYNPYYMQVQDADSATAGVQIAAGSLMPNTLANSVDAVNGKITFSQITNAGSTYKGSGVLATVTFKALVAGSPKLTLDFAQGATTDTNVASQGSDVLTTAGSGQFTVNNTVTTVTGTNPPPPPTTPGTPVLTSSLKLINASGTYYLIIGGIRHGITNPGMLTSYGFTFAMGKTATAADLALPEGSLLTPGDGSLVKSKEDQTVYLISNQQRYGFVSAAVFTSLGFKFSSVLVVTNPELQSLPRATNLSDGAAAHLPGLDINRNGTVYWIGGDNKLYGYPSLAVYNSWHVPGDFSAVVPANAADNALQVGDMIAERKLE